MKVFLIGMILFAASSIVAGQASHNRSNSKMSRSDNYRAPFRYVIVEGVSKLEKYVNDDPDNLYFEVLMEDQAYTEKNLILLFRMLSARFVERPGLSIYVYTSLSAIRTPEENEDIDLLGPVENYENYKYASFNRNGYGEYFDYGIPGKVRHKLVEIKGKLE